MATKAKSKKISKPVAKKAIKPAAKPVAKKAAKPAAKKVSKPVAKKVAKPVAKKAAKPAPQKAAAKPAKKPLVIKAVASKPIVKKVIKPAPQPVAKKEVKQAPPKPVEKVMPSKPETKPASRPRSRPSRAKQSGEPAPPKIALRDKPVNPALLNPVIIPIKEGPKPAPTPIQYNADGSEKKRYSDAELAEFKDLISKKISDAREEYALLQEQINHANEHGTDDTASTFKMLEDGSDTLAKEEAVQLAARQRKFIEQLENALIRIENKSYGVCRVTGKLIPKERLRAVPHTTQSMEAKLQQYKDN